MFLPLTADSLHRELEVVRHTLRFHGQVEGIVLDLDQLDAANRTLVDAGQCPPVLRVWWLEHLQEDLGAMLYRFIPTRHFWDQISAELVPLTPQLLLAEIQEDPWHRPGWRAVVWDGQLDGAVVHGRRILAPVVDGFGILFNTISSMDPNGGRNPVSRCTNAADV